MVSIGLATDIQYFKTQRKLVRRAVGKFRSGHRHAVFQDTKEVSQK